ncbi:MAG: hypothetical protein ACYTF9_10710 [Planctomycetota bacterium]|jgi:hypothetical protein
MIPLAIEAQTDFIEVIGRGLDSIPGHRLLWLAIIVTAAGGLAAAAVRGLVRADVDRGGAGFRRLANGLGLSHANRRLLGKVALRAGLDCPASMLVSRGAFDHAVRTARPTARDARRLGGLRSRIFTDPAVLVG